MGVEKKVKAVAVKKESGLVQQSPAMMIQMAVQGGADLEKLQGLLDLQMKWEANEARKQYNTSMVLVHKDIPLIGKSLLNPQTHSKYASLDEIICTTKEIYTKEGFSISFNEGETEKADHIRICATVLHQAGHKETYHYDVPLDGKGLRGNSNMTAIHGKASSISYGRRYLMYMIFNIPTGDDDDGNKAGAIEQPKPKVEKKVEPVKAEQIKLSERAEDILATFEICGTVKQLSDYAKNVKPDIDKLPAIEKKYLQDHYILIVKNLNGTK
ncbi:MAG: ERF family protein [Candidatus Woesearchaeota archaeon]